ARLARLGAGLHLLVVGGVFGTLRAAGVAGLGTGVAGEGGEDPVPGGQRARQDAQVAAVDARSHGGDVLLLAVGDQRQAVLVARLALLGAVGALFHALL